MKSDLNFRKFLEYEKIPDGFTSGVYQNLGISPKDQIAQPKLLGNAQLGKYIFGKATYEVIKFFHDKDGNPTKALIKIMDTDPHGIYSKNADGKDVEVPNKPKMKTQLVDIKQLDKMLTQEIPPSGQPQMPAPGTPGMGAM